MADFLMQYGLFLAKAVTVVIAVVITVALAVGLTRRERGAEGLAVKHLNRHYEEMRGLLRKTTLTKKAAKALAKEEKAAKKAQEKSKEADKRRIFVLDFHGDIKATAVASLREEISAVLTLATADDEVVVRLENAGGLVHEHGLAASQLLRIKQKGVPLTVAVDKVAASGGYLMACVADRILAAPFAVVGSIGVLAQIPNFHRFLDQHGVDFEQIKAGEFKRTITLFGENTDADRAKAQEELDDTHALFKEFVAENRPQLDMAQVATGEHWFGRRAVRLALVDELVASDDYLLEASEDADLYQLTFEARKTVSEKIASVIQVAADRLLFSWWQRSRETRLPT